MALFQQGITLKALLENPDLLNPPKPNTDGPKEKKDDFSEIDNIFSGASAFLGPNIWGKDDTLPYDAADLQLEYMDIDEFLNESGIVQGEQLKNSGSNPQPAAASPPPAPQETQVQQWSPPPNTTPPHSPRVESRPQQALSPHSCPSPGSSSASVDAWDVQRSSTHLTIPSPSHAKDIHQGQTEAVGRNLPTSKVPYEPSEGDLELAQIPGQQEFDPRKCNFSEEDLKPQPMIKKSKKVFVPEDLKDDRYWNRRKKNNIAAKRSRDARRIKENQIAMRAAFLEKENIQMKMDMAMLKEENEKLKARLAKYESTT